MVDEKNKLRKQIRHILSQMPKLEVETFTTKIHQNLFSTPEWKNAKTIGITISIGNEIDTYKIIEKAWEVGKRVAVPKCIVETYQLDFYVITNFNQLEKGYFNLYEPVPERTQLVNFQEFDLLIVPGLAFSHNGFRLGQGGGYYDRILKDFQGNTLSLAFDKQLIDTLPVEKHDCKVDAIITEQGVIRTND